MIRYTGNPFVDAGAAVIEYRLKKHVDSIDEGDLTDQAKKLEMVYNRKAWKSYLTVHFPNCAWVQPKIRPEKKREYIDKVLWSHKAGTLDRACAFCGRPANTLADRSHVPLLTGETTMVAGAGGEPGLPVCGFCLLAIHFYPLATLKVAGRPLFWWAPEPFWMRRLTQRFCQQVEKVLSASTDEFTNLRWPSTQLLRAAHEVLDEVENENIPFKNRPPLCDIVGVHATNYGAGPDYDELRIPRGLLEFWAEAGTFRDLYREIEREAWEIEKPKSAKSKGKKAQKPEPSPILIELNRRNRLYEALGNAFRSNDYREEAKQVAVHFFMRPKGRSVPPDTTALAEFFLEKVAGMEKERLEAIREIADSISSARDVKWLVDKLMRSGRRLYDYIPTMRMVQQKLSSEEIPRPIPWEKFLLALNLSNDDDATANDTWLVSELVLVRIFEQLARDRSAILAELPESESAQSPNA